MPNNLKSILLIPRLSSPILMEPSQAFNDVETAFMYSPALHLKQNWLSRPELAFEPAEVRIGWDERAPYDESALWIWADLVDNEPRNSATKPNQRTWELGDVFEIFASPDSQGCYFEMHVTPENQQLQLCIYAEPVNINGKTDASEDDFEHSKLAKGPLWSLTRRTPKGWQVLASLPLSLFSKHSTGFLSFGRYDYQQGLATPVISSSSPHKEANFHRRFEWTPFELLS